MCDETMSHDQLLKELHHLRRRVEELEAVVAGYEPAEKNSGPCLKQEQVHPPNGEKYRSIVEQSADGIALTDEQGILTEWNVAEETITGLSRADVIGRPVWEVQWRMMPASRKKAFRQEDLKQSVQNYLTTGQAPWLDKLQEVTIRRPDGEQRTIQQRAFRIKTDSGVMLGSITRDVTHLRQFEEALKESEARYRALFEASPNAILVLQNDRIIVANPATVRLLGYSNAEDLIGKQWREAVATDHQAIVIERLKRIETGTLNPRTSVQIVRGDGSRLWIESISVPIVLNGQPAVLVMGQDISDRKQAEEALQQSEATLKSILMTAPIGIGMVQQRVLKWVNDHFCQMLGYQPEELIEQNSRILYATEAEYLQVGRDKYRQIDETGMGAVETQMVCKNGNLVDIHLRSSPINLNDYSQGVIFTALDITDRREAEAALQKRNQELALLNRASEAFISTLDLDQVMEMVLEEARHMLDVVACSVWLTEPGAEELICRHAFGPGSEQVRGWQLKPGQGLAGWVVKYGQSLLVPDTRSDSRHFKGVDQTIGLELRSILSVPLKVKQRVIGALHLADTKPGRFTNNDQTLIESLAASAAIAIDNARLYKQTRQDAETKTILLQEVNHRVGNNLTAISGMLSLERYHLKKADEAAYQSIMKDLTNRVNGLATVHSLLSASEWKPLRLDELIKQVIDSSLQMLPPSKHVAVTITPSTVRVTSDQAHNLALVINELATNSVKYALQDRSSAKIKVTIRVEADDWVNVELRDDGPGYPPGVLGENQSSVGLNLVRSLTCRNLRGNWSIHNDAGAVTSFQFKAKAETLSVANKEPRNRIQYR